MEPEELWTPSEESVESFSELEKVLHDVFRKWPKKTFAWRGQVDSRWPLHSSLFRRLMWTKSPGLPDEKELYRYESQILVDLHRWGLHMSPTLGRLSILNQLAALQHYGAPTRLVDVTFNPWIGAWFAVEPKKTDDGQDSDENDARMFAIDVTSRLINERSDLRSWEDSYDRPWRQSTQVGDLGGAQGDAGQGARKSRYLPVDWCTKVFAWRPPHFDGRIAAQNGGFVFGGVPLSTGPKGPNLWPKGNERGFWKIEEVRSATSLSLRPHKLRTKRGGVSQDALYTIRIRAGARTKIREKLQRQFGYEHRTIYPDFTGFALYGSAELRERPPQPAAAG